MNKTKQIGFALLTRASFGYGNGFERMLDEGKKPQPVKPHSPVKLYATREEVFNGRSYRESFPRWEEDSPVIVELEIISGTIAKPEIVKIISVQEVKRKEVDPGFIEPDYETYQPRTADQMKADGVVVKDGESEEEFYEDEDSYICEISDKLRNQFSPAFIKKVVMKEYPDTDEEKYEPVNLGGKDLILLGETEIDGGKGMPSLSFVYNLKEGKRFELGALYYMHMYEKIDPNKLSYAFYKPNSGASDDPGILIEIK